MMQAICLLLWVGLMGFAIGWGAGRRRGRIDRKPLADAGHEIASIVRKARDTRKFVGGNYTHHFQITLTVDGEKEPATLIFGEHQ